MPTTCLKIQGLRDVTSTGHLEKALEAVPGVRSVEIDPAGEQAIVEHDAANPRLLTTAAAGLGYHAAIADAAR